MPERFRRNFLKDKESKALLAEASIRLKANVQQLLKPKTGIELVETDYAKVYLADGKPIMARTQGNLFPTLLFAEFVTLAPKAVVDMGAIPFVCKGANVMRPGIRRFNGDFAEGDMLFVVDEKYGRPLVVGEALMGKDEAEKGTQGPVIKNLHFVGDRVWNLMKELTSQ